MGHTASTKTDEQKKKKYESEYVKKMHFCGANLHRRIKKYIC